MNYDDISALQAIMDASRKIVFFTGAGVSTESGIPDFRNTDGLYNQSYRYPPETIISHDFFMADPEEFYRFYRDRMIYQDARPNAAHLKMAEFEKAGRSLGVVTQNIDGLHQLAGSKKVYELHGAITRNYCTHCHQFYSLKDILEQTGVPHCEKCGSIIKPDVVLYQESLDYDVINKAVDTISQADTLVVAGTSLVVYPAAGFLNYFRGRNLVLINLSVTSADRGANLVIRGKVGEVLSQIEVR